MPRIDPLQLLNCLSVLLRGDGGIRSDSEVQRLASLMTKFSKKLVSKCIYVQILKRSETRLLGLFMGSGGWALTHMWLTDGIVNRNWALVQELLELLLLCPVNVDLLKTNNCPKLVKGLSKDESHEGVRLLAGKLVEQWLRIVKGESQVPPVHHHQENEPKEPCVPVQQFKIIDPSSQLRADSEISTLDKDNKVLTIVKPSEEVRTIEEPSVETKECVEKHESEVTENGQTLHICKATTDNTSNLKLTDDNSENVSPTIKDKDKDKESSIKDQSKNKEKKDKEKYSSGSSNNSHKSSPRSSSSKHSSNKSSGSNSSSSSGSSGHRSKSSNKDKDRKSSHKSSSKDKDREREKEKEKEKEKERERSKQEEKDRATLDKLKPKTLDKVGKIPKKVSTPDEDKSSKIDVKKPSISIEVRKSEGNRPKTVKTFNSKFRSHGLEEEAKPPPPRPVKKSSNSLPVVSLPAKRPSPPRYDVLAQPEKKAKIAEAPVHAKPGAIKLIPAKPKPALLMESDMFMDALSASATNKKEPRKRKRKLSASKDCETEQQSPTIKAASPPQSPKSEETIEAVEIAAVPAKTDDSADDMPKNMSAALAPAPPRFYQDTLENTDEEKDTEKDTDTADTADEETDPPEISEPEETEKDYKPVETQCVVPRSDAVALKGVLLYSKRKGPKKKLQWRSEPELVDIQYFELDETERVNVTKTFTDMKQMERVNEREAFQLARKLPNEDTMEERTTWMILIPVDDVAVVNFGKNSREKDIQYARERTVAPAMYYHRMMIPESPAEPDPELCSITDPTIIPLDDVTGNSDTVNDFQNTPWPEPKGVPPPPVITAPVTPFSVVPPMMPFPPHGPPGVPFPIPPFPGHPGPVPPFQMRGPNPDSMPPIAPDMMMNGGMFPPRMDGPPVDGNMMQMNGFGPPFGGQFSGPNPGVGFPTGCGRGGGGGGMRPMGNMGGGGPRCPPNSGWYRPPGSGPGPGPNGPGWQSGPPPSRGKGWNNPRICRQFRKGYCNKGDNCQYLHPGINCPPL